MVSGILIMGFGLAVLRKLQLGTDPCSCFTLGLVSHIPLSFGTCQLLCHLVTFLFVIRYDLSKISYGTIVNMVFLGYISDFFTWIFDMLLPVGFFDVQTTRLGLLLPALIVFIFGASAYMCADIGMSPYDALPFIITDHNPRFSFKFVRTIWDVSFMAAGFLLGGAVGIVTVLAAFFLGPVISWMRGRLEVFVK